MLLVNDKPNVLHYTGTDEKELLDLMQEDKPDLTVSHDKEFPKAFLKTDKFWIWHPIKNEKELYATKRLLTNSHRMCQMYYQRLGLQAEIEIFSTSQNEKKKDELKFAFTLRDLKIFFQRFCDFMSWK